VVGSVERYGDGTIVVLAAGGYQAIRLDATTVIARPSGPAGMDDLRPGVGVAVWRPWTWHGPAPTARALFVLGG
jgi:hypothetical protein